MENKTDDKPLIAIVSDEVVLIYHRIILNNFSKGYCKTISRRKPMETIKVIYPKEAFTDMIKSNVSSISIFL